MDADSFQIIASCTFVTSEKLSVVWSVIAIEDRMLEDMPSGIAHRITADHAPGEHDCILEGTVEGRAVSAPGSRHLDVSSHTITELRHHASEDHRTSITFARQRFSGTRVTMTVAFRSTTEVVNIDRLPSVRARWNIGLAQRRANLLCTLASG